MSLETRYAILDALLEVLDHEHAVGLMDHRKAKKAPLTPLAAKILLKQLRLCPDANEAVEEMINRGWTGLKADWLPNRTQQFTPSGSNRKPNVVDAMQQIFEERGWTNGPGSVRGDFIDDHGIPAERGQSKGVVVDIRAGAYRRG